MTLPYERTRAVKQTHDFLRSLTDAKETPRVPGHIRKQALWLLRHYPSDAEMETIANREDMAIQLQYQIFGTEQAWTKTIASSETK